MDIWLKELSIDYDRKYYNLLMELSSYEDVFAKPVPEVFPYEEFIDYLKARFKMKDKNLIPASVMPTSTYWVMDGDKPIGYATLKHEIDLTKPGGHFGCCLKKEYQNKGLSVIVADKLSEIAYNEYGINSVVYTAKDEKIQSQKSIAKIGWYLTSVHDGYHYYIVDLKEKYEKKEGR